MAPDKSGAPELIRRLLAQDAATDTISRDSAATFQLASARLYRELSRWIGRSGCNTLFARALAQAQLEHPSLRKLRLAAATESGLTGLDDLLETDGNATVAAGLEAMLVALLELIGRLIGDDMTSRLAEQSVSNASQDAESLERRSTPS